MTPKKGAKNKIKSTKSARPPVTCSLVPINSDQGVSWLCLASLFRQRDSDIGMTKTQTLH